ncbi:dihydrofolate reductase family protein [Leucobacter sp. CSA2]|uniref:Riboflavin biosynthesis protein RibD n=1 Tax=Leucobacter edaphi TaxID=2796472 RepID=A0A934UXM4_9MICO|nr:dihydrofolate reductase family protein [Leucobacter edaphi]MBK0422180.1 dihydrofolate reductase family protein [Leucobacter edaphi]
MLERRLLEEAMRRALELAERGPADNANPQVGCVILDPSGRIVAEGWHLGSGTPHAEVDALAHLPAEWRSRAGELTAVVTLEPCNHTGRTGPCAVALVDSGIGHVAYALSDPGDASSGGAETLRAAGVEVLSGIEAASAESLLAPWFERAARAATGADQSLSDSAAAGGAVRRPAPRPRVIAKWAQTLDGRAAAADGTSQWITGAEARADVHRRRAAADAILVGTGTLLADDPALTARDAEGGLLVPPAEQPIPVVLGRRDIPAGARVLAHPALSGAAASGSGTGAAPETSSPNVPAALLAPAAPAAPIRLSGENLEADLAELASRGFESVFVEGGPTVTSALIAAGLVDELLIYVAPALLGGPRLALGYLGIPSMSGIRRLTVSGIERLGSDLLIEAVFAAAGEEA